MRKFPAILAVVGSAVLAVLLPVIGFAGQTDLSQSTNGSLSSANARDGACNLNDADDIEYLIFWDGYNSIDDFVAKLGITGDGVTRQLGFGAIIPVWVPDKSYIIQAIKEGFDTAKRTNVAVHFNADDHIGWDKRPDLWNWYDLAGKGYNPDNRKNVEWYDWEGLPISGDTSPPREFPRRRRTCATTVRLFSVR